MKKILLLLALFAMETLLNPAKGQEVIEIDLSQTTSKGSLNKKLRTGDWYQIRLKNINLNAFKVDVSTADSFYTFSLKTPSFDDLPSEALSTLGSDLLSSIDISLFDNVDEGITEELLKGLDLKGVSPSPNNPLSKLILTAFMVEQDIIEFKTLYNIKMMEVDNLRNEAIVEGKINESLHAFIIKKTNELQLELETLNDALSRDKISPLLLQSRFIDKNNTMTYSTLPQRFNGTKATISVVLTPRDSSYMLNTYSTKFVIEQKKSIYFGTGLSFYVAGLSDQNFSTVKKTSATDTTYSVVAEDKTNFEVGISSLLRAGFYHQRDHKAEFGGHFSFGPGVSISEKVRPRILLGLGISIGSGKHAISIDGGSIFGSEQKKSNSINDGDVFSERPEKLTVSTPKISWFGSFGYMLKF
ncbi:MAG: hypothetical protein ABJR05_05655 [Balneola sp.]